jgi:hypothetical protein
MTGRRIEALMKDERSGPIVLYGGIIALAAGVVIMGIVGVRLLQVPWDLDARSPTTTSVASVHTYLGNYYTIEVGGRRFECRGGAGGRSPGQHEVVAYDPRDPGRCRLASMAGRVGPDEGSRLLTSVFFIALGLPGLLWRLAYRGTSFPFSKETAPAHPGFLRAAEGALIVSGVVFAGFTIWALLGALLR